MNASDVEETSFFEIECRIEPTGRQDLLREVHMLLRRVLDRSNGESQVRSERQTDGAGGTIQVRCSGRNTARWDTIKQTLRERGLLEQATVYQHHPALKCRTKIWP